MEPGTQRPHRGPVKRQRPPKHLGKFPMHMDSQESMRVTCWDRPEASVSSSRQRLVTVPPSQIRPRRREGPRASRRALWGARGRPSLALGRALRRLGFFRPASLSTPPGPLPDPSTPRPHKRRLPVAVERAREQVCPHPGGCRPLPHTQTSKGSRKQWARLTPAGGRSQCHGSARGPTAGDFPSRQDVRRTPRLWPLSVLRNQGLGRGRAGWLGSMAGMLEDPCPLCPQALLATGPGTSAPGLWDLAGEGWPPIQQRAPPPAATAPPRGEGTAQGTVPSPRFPEWLPCRRGRRPDSWVQGWHPWTGGFHGGQPVPAFVPRPSGLGAQRCHRPCGRWARPVSDLSGGVRGLLSI